MNNVTNITSYRPAWSDERARAIRLFSIPFAENEHLHLTVATKQSRGRDRLLACLAIQVVPRSAIVKKEI